MKAPASTRGRPPAAYVLGFLAVQGALMFAATLAVVPARALADDWAQTGRFVHPIVGLLLTLLFACLVIAIVAMDLKHAPRLHLMPFVSLLVGGATGALGATGEPIAGVGTVTLIAAVSWALPLFLKWYRDRPSALRSFAVFAFSALATSLFLDSLLVLKELG